ncbi:MAG TPA: hypothetical protein VFK31_09555 [Rhodanobacteraceae bacterium]|nr:hypothetical protein [Rhodanobacteraceae bacterium]
MTRLPSPNEAFELGRAHRASGKLLTPHDCIEFDRRLLDGIRGNKDGGSIYAQLRGEFNRGFSCEHNATMFPETTA